MPFVLGKLPLNFRKKVSFKIHSQAAGLWASAIRWGFGKEEFERLGAAKVYDLVARFSRIRAATGNEIQKLDKELKSNFGRRKYSEIRQKIDKVSCNCTGEGNI